MPGNYGSGWGDLCSTLAVDLRNDWHFVLANYDGSKVDFYVDGNQLGDSVQRTGSFVSTSKTVKIGWEDGYGSGSQSYKGYIDDVRIYNRPLLESEITELYNDGAGTEID